MTAYRSNWFTLLLLRTNAPLVLCCDQFDRGSRQVKRELLDLAMEDYDVSLCLSANIVSSSLLHISTTYLSRSGNK